MGRLAAILSAFLCLLGLLQAMAPPLKWDALVYHLTLPAHYPGHSADTRGFRALLR
jgi:hypothetical protein